MAVACASITCAGMHFMLLGLPVVTLTLATCNHAQLCISLSCLHLHSLPASASTATAGLTPPTRARISMHCLHQPAPACPASTTLISKHRRCCSAAAFRFGVTRAVPRSAALRCVLAQSCCKEKTHQQPPHGKNARQTSAHSATPRTL
jgi:hypothetical protein